MSTISVSGLSTFYQANSPYSPQVQAPDSTDPTVATDASGTTSGTTDASAATQQAPHAHRHHHGGGGGGGEFFSKLQSAVTTALQAAQSGGSTDANQAVQNAIESVLNPQSDSSTDGTAAQSATAPGSTTDASAAVDPQAAREQFFQTLQSYGVDPQQFHQDFVSAIQAAHNGQVDPSSAFQSLPPGSVVDETA